MLLKELLEKIKDSTALTEAQKNKCLALIPHLNRDRLRELAATVLWLENQDSNLNKEEVQITSKLKLMFTKMNHYAVHEGKKRRLESTERASKAEDEANLNSLIQEL